MTLRSVRSLALCAGIVFSAGLAACGRGAQPEPAGGLQPAVGEAALRVGARGVCVHYDPTDWDCPDTNRFLARARDVDSVSVTVWSGRDRYTVRITRPEADAIFLSRNAVELFLLRYYDAVDPRKAADLRALLDRRPR